MTALGPRTREAAGDVYEFLQRVGPEFGGGTAAANFNDVMDDFREVFADIEALSPAEQREHTDKCMEACGRVIITAMLLDISNEQGSHLRPV